MGGNTTPGLLRDPVAADSLIERTQDPEPWVRKTARTSLSMIAAHGSSGSCPHPGSSPRFLTAVGGDEGAAIELPSGRDVGNVSYEKVGGAGG